MTTQELKKAATVCEKINGTELTKIFFSLSRQNFQA